MASEFELINFLFEPLSKGLSASEIGIGDDGAVLNVPEDHQLVVVTDTLVSGVHFPESTSSYDVAWKAVAVNLSDLAAMGAAPGFYSLALTIPDSNQSWLTGFAKGLADIGNFYGIPLIGGDTTNGPLTITVTAQGWVPKGKAVTRSGAQVGDVICVTNCIGDGALGLMVALNTLPEMVHKELSSADIQHLLDALNLPKPQLALSEGLREYATSAIDISDGLLADLSHVLEESNKPVSSVEERLVAEVYLENIPLSQAATIYIDKTQDWLAILTGGDDYQLCLTISEANFEQAKSMADKVGVKLTDIGRMASSLEFNGEGTALEQVTNDQVVLLKDGKEVNIEGTKGYMHF